MMTSASKNSEKNSDFLKRNIYINFYMSVWTMEAKSRNFFLLFFVCQQARESIDKTQNPMLKRTRSGNLHKPSQTASESYDPKTFLAAHTKELQDFVLLNLRPSQIAERFRVNFGVALDQKQVSDRISYLKKNKMITVPPTNQPDSMRAEDQLEQPPKKM